MRKLVATSCGGHVATFTFSDRRGDDVTFRIEAVKDTLVVTTKSKKAKHVSARISKNVVEIEALEGE